MARAVLGTVSADGVIGCVFTGTNMTQLQSAPHLKLQDAWVKGRKILNKFQKRRGEKQERKRKKKFKRKKEGKEKMLSQTEPLLSIPPGVFLPVLKATTFWSRSGNCRTVCNLGMSETLALLWSTRCEIYHLQKNVFNHLLQAKKAIQAEETTDCSDAPHLLSQLTFRPDVHYTVQRQVEEFLQGSPAGLALPQNNLTLAYQRCPQLGLAAPQAAMLSPSLCSCPCRCNKALPVGPELGTGIPPKMTTGCASR